MVGKDNAYWAKLNDERLEIEDRIHARARLDHALDGRYTLLSDEKDKLLDLIRDIRLQPMQSGTWRYRTSFGTMLESRTPRRTWWPLTPALLTWIKTVRHQPSHLFL